MKEIVLLFMRFVADVFSLRRCRQEDNDTKKYFYTVNGIAKYLSVCACVYT